MIATAWNNGSHNRNGSGYGLKLSVTDRDEFFKQDWDVVILEIEGEAEPVEVLIDNFINEGRDAKYCVCTGTAIGRWLRHNGLAPWAKGSPPTFVLDPVEGNRFKLLKSSKKSRSAR